MYVPTIMLSQHVLVQVTHPEANAQVIEEEDFIDIESKGTLPS